MKSLYDILESILDDDDLISADFGNTIESYARYLLFLECFSDILYKDTPYSRSGKSITFELSRELWNVSSEDFYKDVKERLDRYISLLNKTYRGRYVFSYKKGVNRHSLQYAMTTYCISIYNKKDHTLYKVLFKARNLLDGRRVDIDWDSNNDDFEFMRTEK